VNAVRLIEEEGRDEDYAKTDVEGNCMPSKRATRGCFGALGSVKGQGSSCMEGSAQTGKLERAFNAPGPETGEKPACYSQDCGESSYCLGKQRGGGHAVEKAVLALVDTRGSRYRLQLQSRRASGGWESMLP